MVGGSVAAGVLAFAASFIIAAGWMVAASVNARVDLRTTQPSIQQTAVWREPPHRAAGYLDVAQMAPGAIIAPNLHFDVAPTRAAVARSTRVERLTRVAKNAPDVTNSTPPVRAIDLPARGRQLVSADVSMAALPPAMPKLKIAEPDAVPLPRIRPRLASIELKAKVEAAPPVPEPDPASRRTAIYDIEAHTVYMPNGDRLEAHSGLGDWMDDPSSLRVKNRGVTPPNTYQLTLRESLFHGVQAIRLNPVDENKMFGRDGILAHSYMLGPNGQSNGCVSFKDYQQFLRAFLRGDVDRIVVVERRGDGPPRIARIPERRSERYALNTRRSYTPSKEYAAVRMIPGPL